MAETTSSPPSPPLTSSVTTTLHHRKASGASRCVARLICVHNLRRLTTTKTIMTKKKCCCSPAPSASHVDGAGVIVVARAFVFGLSYLCIIYFIPANQINFLFHSRFAGLTYSGGGEGLYACAIEVARRCRWRSIRGARSYLDCCICSPSST